MINEFFKNITLDYLTVEMIQVSGFMTLIIAIADIAGALFANRNAYIQEVINIITLIINAITLILIMYCYSNGLTINIYKIMFFGIIFICAISVNCNTKTFSEKIRIIAENEEVVE